MSLRSTHSETETIVTTPFMPMQISDYLWRRLRAVAGSLCVLVAACGGGADAPPPKEGAPLAMAPVITQQPVDLSVTNGQPASFTVAATGTPPLTYQWQRNGAAIAGATAATYSIASAAPTDTSAVFSAVVSNVAGSATSNNATLTVTTAPPVLTITQQPVDLSVTAGASANFIVAATCSSGTLNIQWQRNSGAGNAFVSLAGANAANYMLASTAINDSGARWQAVLDCSGQSATTSQAATLTVGAPSSVTLDLFPVAGLRNQALIGAFTPAIDLEASGSYVLVVGNAIKRLSSDLSSMALIAGSVADLGAADGLGAAARFASPAGLTHDVAGNVYVADTNNNSIRRIAPDGTVTTLAGGSSNSQGNTDGTGSVARFRGPAGMAIGPDGDLYVADANNNRIRRVTAAGVVTTYAGSSMGYADASSPLAAQFSGPSAVAVAANGDVLVADTNNSRIRRILRSGVGAGAVQTLAGSGGNTSTDPTSPDATGTAAVIPNPSSLALRGNVLTVSDGAGLVRQIDLTTTVVTTLTGSRTGAGYVDGSPAMAKLRAFSAMAPGPNGSFVVSETAAIRLVSANGNVTTIAHAAAADANNSDNGLSDGIGVLAQLPLGRSVQDLAVDSSGRVIIGDGGANILRRIDTSGQVSLFAGLAFGTVGMVDGVGSAAQFSDLKSAITQDSAGNLYVGDFAAVRKVASDGTTTLLAGGRVDSADPTPQFGAVDGNATTARFNTIGGLAVGTDGAIYVSDAGNYAIRRIDTAGNVTTYAGMMGQRAIVDGTRATARFQTPTSLAFGPDGALYVSDSGQLRRISADGTSVTTLQVGSLVGAQVFGSDGTMYFATSTGLRALSPGASSTSLLIAGGVNDQVVLGNAPHLGGIAGLAVYGPKQLIVISGFQVLKVTLP